MHALVQSNNKMAALLLLSLLRVALAVTPESATISSVRFASLAAVFLNFAVGCESILIRARICHPIDVDRLDPNCRAGFSPPWTASQCTHTVRASCYPTPIPPVLEASTTWWVPRRRRSLAGSPRASTCTALVSGRAPSRLKLRRVKVNALSGELVLIDPPDDLQNWKFENEIFHNSSITTPLPEGEIPYYRIERPKVGQRAFESPVHLRCLTPLLEISQRSVFLRCRCLRGRACDTRPPGRPPACEPATNFTTSLVRSYTTS
eukprot:SAG11_NODE_3437_length_2448_cov_1.788846_3_plen_263_part_00